MDLTSALHSSLLHLTFVIMLVMDAFVLFRKSSMKKSGVQDEGHRGS